MNTFREHNVEILRSGGEESLHDERDTQLHHTPYEWEQQLLRYVRDGNLPMVNKLFAHMEQRGSRIGKLSDSQLRQAQYHGAILAYQLSRTAIQGGMYEVEAHNRSDAHIQQIDKATTVEEVLRMNAEMIREWTQAIHDVQHRRELSPAIRKCQDYIFGNLHAKIYLEDLARICDLSVPYLSSRFKQEVGKTITAYIRHLKIKTAQDLLLNTRRTSKNIAYLLNFSSQSYFIKCFKRETGMSPREYREDSDDSD